jgi:hypothetical protein
LLFRYIIDGKLLLVLTKTTTISYISNLFALLYYFILHLQKT